MLSWDALLACHTNQNKSPAMDSRAAGSTKSWRIGTFIKRQLATLKGFLVFEIRKNLDLRTILFTPKIFLKSRFYCTTKVLLNSPRVKILIWLRSSISWFECFGLLERKISDFATSISIFYPYPLKNGDVIYGRPLTSPCVHILIWLRSSMSWLFLSTLLLNAPLHSINRLKT